VNKPRVRLIIPFFVILFIQASLPIAAAEWVSINGTVDFNGTPVVGMVLANGQYVFTNNPVGEYNLDVPLNTDGEITLWVRISGTLYYDGTPLCAMVLANGQSMFSCGANLGTFDLEVPLDEDGQITFYAFCSGFAPYKDIFAPYDPGTNAEFKLTLKLKDEDGQETTTFGRGELITFELTIQNLTNSIQTVDFSDGQQYDFIVYSTSGEPVWVWSDDKAFIQVTTELSIEANESITFSETWNQEVEEGILIQSGNYKAQGRIPAEVRENTSSQIGFAVQ